MKFPTIDDRVITDFDYLPATFTLNDIVHKFDEIYPANYYEKKENKAHHGKMYWHNQLQNMKKAGMIKVEKENKYVKSWIKEYTTLDKWFMWKVKKIKLDSEKLRKEILNVT